MVFSLNRSPGINGCGVGAAVATHGQTGSLFPICPSRRVGRPPFKVARWQQCLQTALFPTQPFAKLEWLSEADSPRVCPSLFWIGRKSVLWSTHPSKIAFYILLAHIWPQACTHHAEEEGGGCSLQEEGGLLSRGLGVSAEGLREEGRGGGPGRALVPSMPPPPRVAPFFFHIESCSNKSFRG